VNQEIRFLTKGKCSSSERYRLSIKREAHGVAGAYIDEKLQVGDILDVSAARGGFTLRAGEAPVVLLSAGIGATPGAGDAPRVGRRGVAEGSLVAPWSPQRP
jgi:NAD(P)H-flavin reductase